MTTYSATVSPSLTVYEVPGAVEPIDPPGTASFAAAGSFTVGTRKAGGGAAGRTLGGAANVNAWSRFEGALIALPTKIALGNVVSTTTRTVHLWNTSEGEAVASGTSATGADGLSITGWTAASSTVPPRRSIELELTATPVGPLLISASYVFAADALSAALAVSGSRGIVFDAIPSRSSSSYREARRWATRIHVAQAGQEARRALIPDDGPPPRRVELPLALFGAIEQGRALNLARFAGSHGAFVPLWLSASLVDGAVSAFSIPAQTAQREFIAGANVLLVSRAGASIVRQIAGVSSSAIDVTAAIDTTEAFPAGESLVVPLILAAVARDSRIRARAYRSGDTVLVFEEIEHPAAAAAPSITPTPATYLGVPVFDVDQIEVDAAEVVTIADGELQGASHQARALHYRRESGLAIRLIVYLRSRAQRAFVRDWFDDRKGMLRSFWTRTIRPAATIRSAASAGVESVSLSNAAEIFGTFGVRRHVWINRLSQAVELSNPREGASADEVLVDCTPAISGDLEAGDEIEVLIFGRFAADELSIAAAGLDGTSDDEAAVAELLVLELVADTPTNA